MLSALTIASSDIDFASTLTPIPVSIRAGWSRDDTRRHRMLLHDELQLASKRLTRPRRIESFGWREERGERSARERGKEGR
eukprot:2778690-Rhodomonas_salina.3